MPPTTWCLPRSFTTPPRRPRCSRLRAAWPTLRSIPLLSRRRGQGYDWQCHNHALQLELHHPAPPATKARAGRSLLSPAPTDGFGRYYGEILHTEGLNDYLITDISNVTANLLSAYDVVILAHMALSDTQATMFGNWVTGWRQPDRHAPGYTPGLPAGYFSGWRFTLQCLPDGEHCFGSRRGNGQYHHPISWHGRPSTPSMEQLRLRPSTRMRPRPRPTRR